MHINTVFVFVFIFAVKPGIDCARLPRIDAGHEHGKQTNEFAAHEQLRAAAARNRYETLQIHARTKTIFNLLI
jgi:hypothetical protein